MTPPTNGGRGKYTALPIEKGRGKCMGLPTKGGGGGGHSCDSSH